MTTSLNVSHKLDRISVDLLIAVDSTVAASGITYCIIGAFARDVVLGLCFGISTGEATRDIDFGLMLDDWAQFDMLRSRLLAHEGFSEHRGVPHRLTFRGVRQLERKPGEIAWPPEFSIIMSTVGLREAHARSLRITVAEGISIPFASPAALTLLKLIAWSERGSAVNRKDARDLALLMTTYLRAGNESRLYSEHTDLVDEADFDLEAAGARILGRDLGVIAGREVGAKLVQILDSGMGPSQGESLIRALPLGSELARQLLQSLRKGLQEIASP